MLIEYIYYIARNDDRRGLLAQTQQCVHVWVYRGNECFYGAVRFSGCIDEWI